MCMLSLIKYRISSSMLLSKRIVSYNNTTMGNIISWDEDVVRSSLLLADLGEVAVFLLQIDSIKIILRAK